MSKNNITFLVDVLPNYNGIFYISNPSIKRFYFNDFVEIRQILDSLEKDKVYVLSLELIYSWLCHEEDDPVITLTKPFLVTRDSNPLIISEYFQFRINLACNTYLLEYTSEDYDDPGVLVKYKEINLF